MSQVRFALAYVFATSLLAQFVHDSNAQRTNYAPVPRGTTRVMFPAHEGVAYGIALTKTQFRTGEAIPIAVWVDNCSDEQFQYLTCTTFMQWGVAVYDVNGKRMLTVAEQKRKEGQPMLYACARDFAIVVPANTCAVPDPSFSLDLHAQYSLGPGRYFLTEMRQPSHGNWTPLKPDAQNALAIEIVGGN